MENSLIADCYFYFIGLCDGIYYGKWFEINGSKLKYDALLLLVGINNIFKRLKKDDLLKHKQATEIFRIFLKNEKNRITPERFEVMDAALDYDGHFGADDLYVLMKNENSSISRATVYKTLELLVQCNLLSKRHFGENLTRYESSFKRKVHDHLICIDCGRIVEFSDKQLSPLPDKISRELGFEFESYSFNIFARCSNPKNCEFSKDR